VVNAIRLAGEVANIHEFFSKKCNPMLHFVHCKSDSHIAKPNSDICYSAAAKYDVVETREYQIEKMLRHLKRTSSGWD